MTTPEAGALTEAARRLEAAGVGRPHDEATRLLRRAAALAGPGSAQEVFADLVAARSRHVPLEYLEGVADFMGHAYVVDPRVQVTRAVMKHVVEAGAALVDEFAAAAGGTVPTAEIGTGNGALAVELARATSAASPIYATDISAEALEVAEVNVTAAGLGGRITLRAGHLLDPVPEDVAVVIANLPFVSRSLRHLLDPGVEENEPALAVFGAGASGWGLQRELLRQAGARVKVPGAFVVTFHISQETEARDAAREYLPHHRITVRELRPGWSGVLILTESTS